MGKRVTGKVYTENLRALADPAYNLSVNQGGTSSGKTYGILQLIKDISLRSKGGVLTSVLSHSVPHLKLGVIRDMQKICASEGIPWNYNSTDKVLKVGKSEIEFLSADKLKAHGGRRDFLFANEANGIEWDVFKQMYVRTKRHTFIDYNPTTEFWYNEYIEGNDEEYPYHFIHSTYKDNLALDPLVRAKLDKEKPGSNFHRVYILGLQGITEGVIFTNWEQGQPDITLPYALGVDWGHTDPDAVVKVSVDKKRKIIYVEQLYYQVGNGTDEITNKLLELKGIYGDRTPFICDTAGAKLITTLRNRGLNLPYFKKPKIIDSIEEIQNYKIVVVGKSPDLIKELKNYIYNDKKSGVPIDRFNHLLDALRYAFTWLTQISGVTYGQRN